MNRKPLIALATLALGTVASFAHAQQNTQLNYGVTVGEYLPSSKAIRDAFGSSVLSYGIGAVGTARPSTGSITPDFNIVNANSNGNKLFIGTYTMGYEYNLASNGSAFLPYGRGFAGLSYFDFGIDVPGRRESLKRLGYTYGAEVGVVVNKRIRLAARYNVYSKENMFDFNGLTFSLTYAFF